MRTDPTDNGGLFLGRRPGTAPTKYRALPERGTAARQRIDRAFAHLLLVAEIFITLLFWGPIPAGALWIAGRVQYWTDNVGFAMEVIGRPRHVIRTQVPQVLELVGLAKKAGRFPNELSGGEQQRVSIARAFVNRPLILLADEPTGNLDPATTVGIMRILDRINRTGTTVCMATHDQRIVVVGAPDQQRLADRPARGGARGLGAVAVGLDLQTVGDRADLELVERDRPAL